MIVSELKVLEHKTVSVGYPAPSVVMILIMNSPKAALRYALKRTLTIWPVMDGVKVSTAHLVSLVEKYVVSPVVYSWSTTSSSPSSVVTRDGIK
ncbi:hypothetical protein ES708_31714 [subsurface metagenome]